MSNLYDHSSIQALIDKWLEQEQQGVTFPVDFDIAWKIAGYSRKDSAKRKLSKRKQGILFHISMEKLGGRPTDIIKLSCDGLKDLALKADTPEGDAIRQYFIEAEKKWRLVQDVNPEFAQQIELLKMQKDIMTLENENLKLRKDYTERRTAIAQLQGVQFLALIDGNPNAVVEIKEKVTETIVCRGNSSVNFAGRSTAQVAKELGFKTGKDLEMWLSQNNADHLICQGLRAVQAPYIPEENIKEVKYLFNRQRSNGSRQLSIGE